MLQRPKRVQVRPQFPAVGQIFELKAPRTMSGMGAIPEFGCHPAGWGFDGNDVLLGAIRRFMLMTDGYSDNLDGIVTVCSARAAIPEGQWLRMFYDIFGHDGGGPIGVADASWTNAYGGRMHPAINSSVDCTFEWAERKKEKYWRWLIAERNPLIWNTVPAVDEQ